MQKLMMLLLFFGLIIGSCGEPDDTEWTYDPTPYKWVNPVFFPEMTPNPQNPMTMEGVLLGRHLYYDQSLSLGGPMEGNACASCHLQKSGFKTPDQTVLAHVNLAWNNAFLWNGKVEGQLEDIMGFEVEEFFQADMANFQTREPYPRLFYEAFGNDSMNSRQAAFAMAQFVRTLISHNSKFDKYLRKELVLTNQEREGMLIFNSEKGDCFHCHSFGLFTDNDFHNIGLDEQSPEGAMGRYYITEQASDIGKFKTPSLRNVGLQQSFMHDGRFSSLREVIDHYNTGVERHENLDPLLDKANRRDGSLGLNEQEISALLAFLHTLTDSTFIQSNELSNPFE